MGRKCDSYDDDWRQQQREPFVATTDQDKCFRMVQDVIMSQ